MTLVELIKSKQISSQDQLRREFRKRALESHPDQNPSLSGNRDFVTLQVDYDSARKLLSAASMALPRRNDTTGLAEVGLMDTFFELVSLGMFDARQRRGVSKSFVLRFQKAAVLFDGRPNGMRGDFKNCIASLSEVEDQTLRKDMEAMFYDMISYRFNHMKYMKKRMLQEID